MRPVAAVRTTDSRAQADFRTLPPGAKLPSGKQCAAWVQATPNPENKGVNRRYNGRTGEHVASNFLQGDEPAADRLIVPRINGNFTGTTREILRWAACKWGINQNIVFAQAAVESWWRQTAEGDYGDGHQCLPAGPPQPQRAGPVRQSYGILQNRYPYEISSFPGGRPLDRHERRHRVRHLALLLRRLRDLAEHGAARQPVPRATSGAASGAGLPGAG